ncbi:MAG: flagellar filament capping protein FliD [Paenibacillaceae bacterium]|nr:flagellar filament capping protein FliD [Paenibacillaceae bacterium]
MVNRITGLSSGMDIDAMVAKMMQAARVPVDKLYQKKQTIEWQRDAYRDMNTTLYDYRNNKLFNQRLDSSYASKLATVTGASSSITAKVSGSTNTKSLTVKVNTLAEVAQTSSAEDIRLVGGSASAFDPTAKLDTQAANLKGDIAGQTSYTFDINGKTITVDTTADSLNSVISRINSQTDVTAYYDKESGRISLTSKDTGSAAKIELTDTDGFLSDIFRVTDMNKTGADASLEINGLATTRSSNKFTVDGIEISLMSPSSSVATVSISQDTDKMVDTIKSFVNDYNTMLQALNDKLNEPKYRDYQPLTDEQKKAMETKEIDLWESKAKSGLLKNDSILSGVVSKMRSAIIAQVDDTGDSRYKTLASIGITTGQYYENGKLYIDETKLRKAIADNPDAVRAIFSAKGSGTNGTADVGVAERIYDSLADVSNQLKTKSGTAGVLTDSSVLGKQLTDVGKQIDDGNKRLTVLETKYYAQFKAMESAINKYNAQSGYLAQAFGQ